MLSHRYSVVKYNHGLSVQIKCRSIGSDVVRSRILPWIVILISNFNGGKIKYAIASPKKRRGKLITLDISYDSVSNS
jgi:hypothetical protein